MVSTGDKKPTDEIQEDSGSVTAPNGTYKSKNPIPLFVSISQRGLLVRENPKGFLSVFKGLPSRARFLKFGSASSLESPSVKFRRFTEEKNEVSRAVPSADQSPRERFKISCVSLMKICKEWFRNPVNMALFVWILCVAISGAILFLVMTGMLDRQLHDKSQRDAWFEVNNQILNALFTLMSLYQHPKRFYHLALLCRWEPKDVLKLRKIYCKNGTYKPNEWMHMMVVVAMLHVNCFAQYALCGLNLGYKRSERPAIGVGLCLAVAIAAPVIAGLYTILSPLGREYDSETDHEAQNTITGVDENKLSRVGRKSFERRYSFVSGDEQRVAESRPEWQGGIFDFWDDIQLAYLSLFCGFCVFGWNMERLGFGNMYVHIATFLLLCMAPFWVFNLAAINIDNEIVRETLGVTGIVLCVFGLLYGGFWRIQMRKRFNLPANDFCCGNAAVTDCAQWLFCCACSLSQEVRTGNFYDVEEDRLYSKQMDLLSPLPREDGSVPLVKLSPRLSPLRGNTSPSNLRMPNTPSPARFDRDGQLPMVEEESSTRGEQDMMTPPMPSMIQREDNERL